MGKKYQPGYVVDGRFVLENRLGAGGSGVVWRAQDRKSGGAPVAVKLLHPKDGRDVTVRYQLEREVQILMRLRHPHIARAIAYQTEDSGELYLAMEYVDGRPLHEAMAQHAQADSYFNNRALAGFIQMLCDAVGYAHKNGIVHRDLKPQNIMVTLPQDVMTPKVLDFGIARLSEASLFDATTHGRQLGSLFYMAPEQTQGQPADARTDVFALGSILFELLTLRRAWARDESRQPAMAFAAPIPAGAMNSVAAVFLRINKDERPRPSLYRKELPAELDRIIVKALSLDPEDRYPSVEALSLDAQDSLRRLTGLTPAADDLDDDPGPTDPGTPAPRGISAGPTLSPTAPLPQARLDRADTPSDSNLASAATDPADPADSGGPAKRPVIPPTLDYPEATDDGPTRLMSSGSIETPKVSTASSWDAWERATDDDDDVGTLAGEDVWPTRVPSDSVRPNASLDDVLVRSSGLGLMHDDPAAGAVEASESNPQVRMGPLVGGPTQLTASSLERRSEGGPAFGDVGSTQPPPSTPYQVNGKLFVLLIAVGLISALVTAVVMLGQNRVAAPVVDGPGQLIDPIPAIVELPPRPDYGHLHDLLAAAKANQSDPAAWTALKDGIVAAARALSDRREGEEIEKIATLSTKVKNVTGLAKCIARLENTISGTKDAP